MTRWNPDREFLAFLKYRMTTILTREFWESRVGKGVQTITVLEELEQGTIWGRLLYSTLFADEFNQRSFEEWKKKKVEYVEWWVEYAMRELAKNPTSALNDFTHPNYSGGLRGWEDWVDQVYFFPASLEDFMLQRRVHQVMLVALENSLEAATKQAQSAGGTWDLLGGLDLAEAYRVAGMVAHVDPMIACAAKVQLNLLAQQSGETLYHLAQRGFGVFMGPWEIRW